MKNVLLAISVICCAAVFAAGQATPTPKVAGPIPVSADSYPFMAANRIQTAVDLSKLGYIEEEFIVSGTANVYDWNADNSISVKTPNAPYTTRILLRRPADPAKFSGNVIVEPLQNARSYDWSYVWAFSHDYFAERGDAFVGITHLPQAIDALKKFNVTRYGSLSMANPTPTVACAPGNTTSPSEEGLQWDIISQVGALLKSNGSPGLLPGYRVEYLYTSSHAGDLVTYVNAIHSHAKLANGKPVYDGYILKTDGNPVRINRCAAAPGANDPRRITKNINVPVFRVIAQGDVLETSALRRPDSDAPGDLYRLYEVTAAPHMDKRFYDHMPLVEDQTKAGQTPFLSVWPLAYQCTPSISLLEFPLMQYVMNAAFMNMDLWARNGTPAPKAERISVKDAGTERASFVTDRFGHALGGVRSPYVEAPNATYIPNSPGPATCGNLGQMKPFDWSQLESVYGNSKNYAAKVSEVVDRMVKDRWFTASDGQRIKAELTAARP